MHGDQPSSPWLVVKAQRHVGRPCVGVQVCGCVGVWVSMYTHVYNPATVLELQADMLPGKYSRAGRWLVRKRLTSKA